MTCRVCGERMDFSVGRVEQGCTPVVRHAGGVGIVTKVDPRLTWRSGVLTEATSALGRAVEAGNYNDTIGALDALLESFNAEELARLFWQRRVTNAGDDLLTLVDAAMRGGNGEQVATELVDSLICDGRVPTMLAGLRENGCLADTEQAQRTLEAAHDAEGHSGPVTWCREPACVALSDLVEVA